MGAARKGAGKLLEAGGGVRSVRGRRPAFFHAIVALRLRFRARGRTLTDKEVDKACRRVLRKVKEENGVEARS